MATKGTLTKISAGLLLAVTLLVVIPEGFVTANSLAGGWFNYEGSDLVDGVTHDRDITEIAFEPAIDPLVLGAAVLAGFVVLLAAGKLGLDKIPTTLHGVAAGMAIGSMALVAGTVMTVLVAIAVLLTLVASPEPTGEATLQPVPIAVAAVAAVASYVLLRNLNVEAAALALLFAAGTFLYTSTVSILSP